MARRFANVLEEEIEEAFFYPSDLVNTKTTIPLRVLVYIHHYSHNSPPLRGIVVYYYNDRQPIKSHLFSWPISSEKGAM